MADYVPVTQEAYEQTARKPGSGMRAVRAWYDESAAIHVQLNNGVVIGVPVAVLPGLESATVNDLRSVAVEGVGTTLYFPNLDLDLSIPQLISDLMGLELGPQRAA